MNVLVFDIETVPDTETGSRIYDLHDLSDGDIAKAMYAKRLQKTGNSEFLPLQLVVSISTFGLPDGVQIACWFAGADVS